MKKKNLAFTLAEVLIVIGIIGVVAALTLPNLNHATGDKERVTKVKKIYSALTEAFDRAQAIYGNYDTWFTDIECEEDEHRAFCAEKFGQRITEFMKVSKVCGLVNDGCFTTGDIGLFNSNYTYGNMDGENIFKVMTPDGMSVGISRTNMYVDIDGPNKGTYTYGKDMFMFSISQEKSMIIPVSSAGGPVSGPVSSGLGASGWIIENDNADYLKTDSSGKCNDSDVVLNWATNTSCH